MGSPVRAALPLYEFDGPPWNPRYDLSRFADGDTETTRRRQRCHGRHTRAVRPAPVFTTGGSVARSVSIGFVWGDTLYMRAVGLPAWLLGSSPIAGALRGGRLGLTFALIACTMLMLAGWAISTYRLTRHHERITELIT